MKRRTRIWLLAMNAALVTLNVHACLFSPFGGLLGDWLIARNLR